MDPTAPVTTGQFTQAIFAILLGFAAPWVVILPALLLVARWWDRRAVRRAQVRWEAWQAAHPSEPPREDWLRRWEIREQLWLESQPAYIQAHLRRWRLEAAEREARVEAVLAAERRAARDGETPPQEDPHENRLL
jgi:hypothetical protein